MSEADQLAWVVRNRRRRSRTRTLQMVAEGVMRQAERLAAGDTGALTDALADVVDGDFTAHCTLGPVRGGVLTIVVDDPRLVYGMRLRWAMDILDALRRRCPRRGVHRLAFAAGDQRGAEVWDESAG